MKYSTTGKSLKQHQAARALRASKGYSVGGQHTIGVKEHGPALPLACLNCGHHVCSCPKKAAAMPVDIERDMFNARNAKRCAEHEASVRREQDQRDCDARWAQEWAAAQESALRRLSDIAHSEMWHTAKIRQLEAQLADAQRIRAGADRAVLAPNISELSADCARYLDLAPPRPSTISEANGMRKRASIDGAWLLERSAPAERFNDRTQPSCDTAAQAGAGIAAGLGGALDRCPHRLPLSRFCGECFNARAYRTPSADEL